MFSKSCLILKDAGVRNLNPVLELLSLGLERRMDYDEIVRCIITQAEQFKDLAGSQTGCDRKDQNEAEFGNELRELRGTLLA